MIIGLCGAGGAGKSTAAEILVHRHGFRRRHIGFPLKNMLRTLLFELGYDVETAERYVDGDLKRAMIPELRVTSTQAQQHIGTDLGRKLWHEDIWHDIWMRWAAGVAAEGHSIVHESLRFPNEVAGVRALGGIIVRIKRPGHVMASGADHESEHQVFDHDVAIWNDGPVDILAARLAGIIDRGPAYGGSTERRAVAHSPAGASV